MAVNESAGVTPSDYKVTYQDGYGNRMVATHYLKAYSMADALLVANAMLKAEAERVSIIQSCTIERTP